MSFVPLSPPASKSFTPRGPLPERGLGWLALLPALLLLPTLAWRPAGPDTVRNGANDIPLVRVPVEETTLVSARKGSGLQVLRGRLLPRDQVTQRAPLNGEVAHVLVKPGQQVALNQRVVILATGAPVRGSSASERRQTQAEHAQIAAVERQKRLESRIQATQQQLEAARRRVQQASQEVSRVRTIVQRLQSGETVERDSALRAPEPPQPGASAPTARMIKQAETARSMARAAAERAAQASLAVQAADQAKRLRQLQLETAAKNLEKTETQYAAPAAETAAGGEDGKPHPLTGADVEAARARHREATTTLEEATGKVAAARREAGRLEALAERYARTAAQATTEVNKALAAANGLRNNPEPTVRPDNSTPSPGLNITEAVALARRALEESTAASREAERLQRQVRAYTAEASQSAARLKSTDNRLEEAQQQVVEDAIQANLSVVRAAAHGAVVQVPSPGQDVRQGQALLAIARSNALQVEFADTGSTWRSLRPGMIVEASLERAVTPAPPGVHRVTPGLPAGALPVAAPAYPPAVESALRLRIARLVPPVAPGQPATVVAQVVRNPRQRQLLPGQTVLCSLPRPGNRDIIALPTSALWPHAGNGFMVAVLEPLGPAGEAVHRISWRPVVTGAGDGIETEIVDGIRPGERVMLQPALLKQDRLLSPDRIQLMYS